MLAGPELGEVGFVPAEDGAGLRLKNEASPHAYSLGRTSSPNARKNPPLYGHTHKPCANCLPWALRWRERVLRLAASHDANRQPTLWEVA